jgi:hypothetical protein
MANDQVPMTNDQRRISLVIGTLGFDWSLGFGHWPLLECPRVAADSANFRERVAGDFDPAV